MAPLTIAIAGFTGIMARLITTSLPKKHPEVRIHGIPRSPEKLPASFQTHKNISVFSAASDDTSALRTALKGANITVCCYLGCPDFMISGQKALIDASIAENVPRYLGSDWSFDFRGLKLGDHPRKDWMITYNKYLEERELEERLKFTHFGSGEEVLEMTTMEDAAAYTAEIAAEPEKSGWFKVLGDRVSIQEIAKLSEQVYGVDAKLEKKGELEDLKKAMQEAFKKDPQNVYSWLGMHYQYWMSNGKTSLGTDLDNGKFLGAVKPTTVVDFLRKPSRETVAKSYLSH